jgi:hypothetical protein
MAVATVPEEEEVMTTARSPLRMLTQQANKIAALLKAVERGDKTADDPCGKIAAALKMDRVKLAVVMDDKILSITMPWITIRETSEAGIAEYVLNQMREARDPVQ